MKSQCYTVVMLILVAAVLLAQDEVRACNQRQEDTGRQTLLTLLKSSDLTKVSSLFAESNKMTVSRGRSGHLRIFVGDVNDELLTTKINRISFAPIERYNAIDAILAIMQTSDVQAKLSKLGVEQPVTVYPGARQEPNRRVPHLPVSLKNVTLEEALDQVAETFGCVIIYAGWTADGVSFFDVSFAHGAKFEGLGRKQ